MPMTSPISSELSSLSSLLQKSLYDPCSSPCVCCEILFCFLTHPLLFCLFHQPKKHRRRWGNSFRPPDNDDLASPSELETRRSMSCIWKHGCHHHYQQLHFIYTEAKTFQVAQVAHRQTLGWTQYHVTVNSQVLSCKSQNPTSIFRSKSQGCLSQRYLLPFWTGSVIQLPVPSS